MNGKIIELNTNLAIKPFEQKDSVFSSIGDKLKIKESNITFLNNYPQDVIYHQGYMGYLKKAWGNHYSIVLNPDHIWNMILSEIAMEVVKNPKNYSELFTTTPDKKKTIITFTHNIEEINVGEVISKLKIEVPTNVDSFFLTFSTSTPMSIMNRYISFCDMVSPYYNYATTLCGIPRIKIEGSEKDWASMISQLDILSNIFSQQIHPFVNGYLTRCKYVISDIITYATDVEFFKRMIKIDFCGSGHRNNISGWIVRFLLRKDADKPITGELPVYASKMNYENLETKRKFRLYSGLFYSHIEGDYLIPSYDAFRIETTKI